MTVGWTSRRQFGRRALLACLTAAAAGSEWSQAFGEGEASHSEGAAARREVGKQVLPGEPERELTLVEVTYPPGTGSPAHLHALGVMAFVVSGTIASQVGDAPERTYRAGEAWWEPPGAVHRTSRNASSTDPAVLLAIYIAPRGAAAADLMKPL